MVPGRVCARVVCAPMSRSGLGSPLALWMDLDGPALTVLGGLALGARRGGRESTPRVRRPGMTVGMIHSPRRTGFSVVLPDPRPPVARVCSSVDMRACVRPWGPASPVGRCFVLSSSAGRAEC